MVIRGRRVNLWVWWSIGWTVTATLLLVRLHFRPVALLVALVVGALVPRVLARCERCSMKRRLSLAALALGCLVLVAATGPRFLPRILAVGCLLGAPPLVAGLLLSGFLTRAQPVVRRALAMVLAFSAVVVAIGLTPQARHRRHSTPRRIVRVVWPLALLGLAAIPPLRWRRSGDSDLQPMLPQQVQ